MLQFSFIYITRRRHDSGMRIGKTCKTKDISTKTYKMTFCSILTSWDICFCLYAREEVGHVNCYQHFEAGSHSLLINSKGFRNKPCAVGCLPWSLNWSTLFFLCPTHSNSLILSPHTMGRLAANVGEWINEVRKVLKTVAQLINSEGRQTMVQGNVVHRNI